MMLHRRVPVVVATILSAVTQAQAQRSNPPDYSIWNPVPEYLLGEMHTDRPTRAASPSTVAPGHVQVEMGVLTYTHDDPRFGAEQLLTFGVNDLRIGLRRDLEIGIITAPLRWRCASKPGEGTDFGFGNVTLRLKYSVWGNYQPGTHPGGPTSLALMPFITLPSGTDGFNIGGVQGGMAVPFSAKLPGRFTLQNTGFAVINAEQSGGARNLRLADALALFYPTPGKLTGFAEYYIRATPSGKFSPVSTLDLGLLYSATPNLQFNFGVYPALTDAAPGLHVILGFARRF